MVARDPCAQANLARKRALLEQQRKQRKLDAGRILTQRQSAQMKPSSKVEYLRRNSHGKDWITCLFFRRERNDAPLERTLGKYCTLLARLESLDCGDLRLTAGKTASANIEETVDIGQCS